MEQIKLRPLKDPLVLYADRSRESREAEKLLRAAGISPFLADRAVEPLQKKPLVVYGGGVYQGLDEIVGLLRLLQFWSEQSIRRDVFRDSSA
jgi:hypothetical protein